MPCTSTGVSVPVGAIPSCPYVVFAPAPDVAAGEQHARVTPSRRSPRSRSVMPCTSTGVSVLAGGAVAELPGTVFAPALDVAAGQQRARVQARRRSPGWQLRCPALRPAHSLSLVVPLPSSPAVAAPAVDVAAGEHRARVIAAGAHLGGVLMPWTLTGAVCVGFAVTELTVGVLTPAVRSGRWTATRTCDRRRPSPGWRVVMPCTSTGVSALVVCAVAELPVVVFAPALDVAAGKQRARVIAARAHLGGSGNALHFDGRIRARVAAVAQLPIFVVTPALDPAARHQSARVSFASAHLGRRFDALHFHRRVRVASGPVPELPEVVFAPASDVAAR